MTERIVLRCTRLERKALRVIAQAEGLADTKAGTPLLRKMGLEEVVRRYEALQTT